MSDIPKHPMLVSCLACGHVWPAVWLPMEAKTMFGIIKRIRCPYCGADPRQVVLASEIDHATWTKRNNGEKS